MTNAETISLIVTALFVIGLLCLIVLAFSRPKEFFRSILIDFLIGFLKEVWERIRILSIILVSPLLLIWSLKINKNRNKPNK